MKYVHQKVLSYLSPEMYKHKKVVDLGGRYGYIIDNLHGTQQKVNLDINKKYLQNSRTPNKVQATLHFLPFKNHVFDLGIFTEVIEHLNNPQKAIREICRVCHNLILTTPNNSPYRKLLWKIRNKKLSSPDHKQEYSIQETILFFKTENYKPNKLQGIGFIIHKPAKIRSQLRRLEILPCLSSKMYIEFTEAQKND